MSINKCTTPSILQALAHLGLGTQRWPGARRLRKMGLAACLSPCEAVQQGLIGPRSSHPGPVSPLLPVHCVVQGTVRLSLGIPAAQPRNTRPNRHPSLPGARHKKTAQSSSYWRAWSRSSRQQSPRRIGWHLSSAINFPLSSLLSSIYLFQSCFRFESRLLLCSHCNTTNMVHQPLRAAGQHIYRRFADDPEKFTLPRWAPAVILADAVLFLPLFLVVRNPHATNSPTPLTSVPRSPTPSAPSSRPWPS